MSSISSHPEVMLNEDNNNTNLTQQPVSSQPNLDHVESQVQKDVCGSECELNRKSMPRFVAAIIDLNKTVERQENRIKELEAIIAQQETAAPSPYSPGLSKEQQQQQKILSDSTKQALFSMTKRVAENIVAHHPALEERAAHSLGHLASTELSNILANMTLETQLSNQPPANNNNIINPQFDVQQHIPIRHHHHYQNHYHESDSDIESVMDPTSNDTRIPTAHNMRYPIRGESRLDTLLLNGQLATVDGLMNVPGSNGELNGEWNGERDGEWS